MTWTQTITIVAPILMAVIGGLFYGNQQFDHVGRRIDDSRADMNARFASVDARFAEVHQDLQELRGLILEALRSRTS